MPGCFNSLTVLHHRTLIALLEQLKNFGIVMCSYIFKCSKTVSQYLPRFKSKQIQEREENLVNRARPLNNNNHYQLCITSILGHLKKSVLISEKQTVEDFGSIK